MPGFDGTGPGGWGPFTGGGRGFCTLVLPPPGTGQALYCYAGLQGTPVPPGVPQAPVGWPPRPATLGWRCFGRCHGWGRRGRW